jgi:hypothetical protein
MAVGCAARPLPAPTPLAPVVVAAPAPPAPLPAPTVSIRLSHTGPDTWAVDYAFSAPTDAVAFARKGIVRDGWKLVSPVDVRRSGVFLLGSHPFRHVAFELTTDTKQPEKEYAPFLRYTDRGRLAYTGQLTVAQATCGPAGCATDDGLASGATYAGEVTLVPLEGETVVVNGAAPAATATVPVSDDGTYAYFGDLAPIETPSAIGVFDRALPPWLGERIAADIPRILALYTEKLGPLDGPKPTVYVTFAKLAKGHSVGGGVLPPRVVSLDVELGPDLMDRKNPKTRLAIDALVAHEAAHFWNGGKYSPSSDPAAAWMHEGTADAMALRALRSAGAIDDDALREKLSLDASACALWLSTGDGVRASTRPGHAHEFYACGEIIDTAVDAACRKKDPSVDLFAFWKTVFEAGKPTYEEEHFLRALDRLAGDPTLSLAVTKLVNERQDDPGKAVRALLARAGVTTASGRGEVPPAYDEVGSVAAVSSLLPDACVKGLAFDGNVGVRPRVTMEGACPGLAPGEVIDTLAGVPIGPHGVEAFAKGYASCRRSRTVDVTTSTHKRAKLACAPSPRPPPAYFRVTAAP